MALLNRSLTEAEIRKMLDATPLMQEYDSFVRLLSEPHYQHVRYDAAIGRTVYEDRLTFYWCADQSPSDSRWMVPGTLQDERRYYR